MPRIEISRTGPGRWTWRSDRGAEGTIEHHDDGTATWSDDPTGNAVTAAMVLRLWPDPPDRIVYEADSEGYRLDPEPLPRSVPNVRPPAPDLPTKLGERYGRGR